MSTRITKKCKCGATSWMKHDGYIICSVCSVADRLLLHEGEEFQSFDDSSENQRVDAFTGGRSTATITLSHKGRPTVLHLKMDGQTNEIRADTNQLKSYIMGLMNEMKIFEFRTEISSDTLFYYSRKKSWSGHGRFRIITLCFYFACHNNNVVISRNEVLHVAFRYLKDFDRPNDLLTFNQREHIFNNSYKTVSSVLMKNNIDYTEYKRPEDYMSRLVFRLRVEDGENLIILGKALAIMCRKAERDSTPKSITIAATALSVAIRMLEVDRSITDVYQVTAVTEGTMRSKIPTLIAYIDRHKGELPDFVTAEMMVGI
ncbi:hypothetical protein PCE1_004144 [Barthelona sp. PCE]